MIPADRFYSPATGPMRQGDILLAGVARLVAEDRYTPPAWERLDSFDLTVEDGRNKGADLRLCAGPALVMVTSHDCHFDKEWNRRRKVLIREGMAEAAAGDEAETDETLDRTFNGSPLIYPNELDLDRGSLMAGRMVGYLPITASGDGLIPEAVVDLTYRVTLDRLDVVRVACVSDEVRVQLRYSLARLETLRATSVGFEMEAVVGRQIERVEFPKTNPLLVQLHLDGGGVIELLQQPGEPPPGPASRQTPAR